MSDDRRKRGSHVTKKRDRTLDPYAKEKPWRQTKIQNPSKAVQQLRQRGTHDRCIVVLTDGRATYGYVSRDFWETVDALTDSLKEHRHQSCEARVMAVWFDPRHRISLRDLADRFGSGREWKVPPREVNSWIEGILDPGRPKQHHRKQ